MFKYGSSLFAMDADEHNNKSAEVLFESLAKMDSFADVVIIMTVSYSSSKMSKI